MLLLLIENSLCRAIHSNRKLPQLCPHNCHSTSHTVQLQTCPSAASTQWMCDLSQHLDVQAVIVGIQSAKSDKYPSLALVYTQTETHTNTDTHIYTHIWKVWLNDTQWQPLQIHVKRSDASCGYAPTVLLKERAKHTGFSAQVELVVSSTHTIHFLPLLSENIQYVEMIASRCVP